MFTFKAANVLCRAQHGRSPTGPPSYHHDWSHDMNTPRARCSATDASDRYSVAMILHDLVGKCSDAADNEDRVVVDDIISFL